MVVVVREMDLHRRLGDFYPSCPYTLTLAQHAPPMTSLDRNRLVCAYCLRTFKRESDKLSHQCQSQKCRDGLAELSQLATTSTELNDSDDLEDDPPDLDDNTLGDNFTDDLFDCFDRLLATNLEGAPRSPAPTTTTAPDPQPPPLPKAPPADSDTVDRYPGAARVLRKETGVFDRWNQKHGHKTNPYHPFKNKLDWKVAQWAKKEAPGATSMDRLLSCPEVCSNLRRAFILLLLHSRFRSSNASISLSRIHASSIRSSTTSLSPRQRGTRLDSRWRAWKRSWRSSIRAHSK